MVRILVVEDRSRAGLDLASLLMFEVEGDCRSGQWHAERIGAVKPILNREKPLENLGTYEKVESVL
jgi:hypothetical protein